MSLALTSFDSRVGNASLAFGHTHEILLAMRVIRTHVCMQKGFCGDVKKICGRPFKMRSVGLARTEIFSVRPKVKI